MFNFTGTWRSTTPNDDVSAQLKAIETAANKFWRQSPSSSSSASIRGKDGSSLTPFLRFLHTPWLLRVETSTTSSSSSSSSSSELNSGHGDDGNSTPLFTVYQDLLLDNVPRSRSSNGAGDNNIQVSSGTSDGKLKLRLNGIGVTSSSSSSWVETFKFVSRNQLEHAIVYIPKEGAVALSATLSWTRIFTSPAEEALVLKHMEETGTLKQSSSTYDDDGGTSSTPPDDTDSLLSRIKSPDDTLNNTSGSPFTADSAVTTTPAGIGGGGGSWICPDFSGSWNVDVTRSQDMEPVFTLMGLPWLVRKAALRLDVITNIEHFPNKQIVNTCEKTSLGVLSTNDMIADGATVEKIGKDGKTAHVTCSVYAPSADDRSEITDLDSSIGLASSNSRSNSGNSSEVLGCMRIVTVLPDDIGTSDNLWVLCDAGKQMRQRITYTRGDKKVFVRRVLVNSTWKPQPLIPVSPLVSTTPLTAAATPLPSSPLSSTDTTPAVSPSSSPTKTGTLSLLNSVKKSTSDGKDKGDTANTMATTKQPLSSTNTISSPSSSSSSTYRLSEWEKDPFFVSLSGTWVTDRSRSQSFDALWKSLGVGTFARLLVGALDITTRMTHTRFVLVIGDTSSLGDHQLVLPLDGQWRPVKQADGRWMLCRATYQASAAASPILATTSAASAAPLKTVGGNGDKGPTWLGYEAGSIPPTFLRGYQPQNHHHHQAILRSPQSASSSAAAATPSTISRNTANNSPRSKASAGTTTTTASSSVAVLSSGGTTSKSPAAQAMAEATAAALTAPSSFPYYSALPFEPIRYVTTSITVETILVDVSEATRLIRAASIPGRKGSMLLLKGGGPPSSSSPPVAVASAAAVAMNGSAMTSGKNSVLGNKSNNNNSNTSIASSISSSGRDSPLMILPSASPASSGSRRSSDVSEITNNNNNSNNNNNTSMSSANIDDGDNGTIAITNTSGLRSTEAVLSSSTLPSSSTTKSINNNNNNTAATSSTTTTNTTNTTNPKVGVRLLPPTVAAAVEAGLPVWQAMPWPHALPRGPRLLVTHRLESRSVMLQEYTYISNSSGNNSSGSSSSNSTYSPNNSSNNSSGETVVTTSATRVLLRKEDDAAKDAGIRLERKRVGTARAIILSRRAEADKLRWAYFQAEKEAHEAALAAAAVAAQAAAEAEAAAAARITSVAESSSSSSSSSSSTDEVKEEGDGSGKTSEISTGMPSLAADPWAAVPDHTDEEDTHVDYENTPGCAVM